MVLDESFKFFRLRIEEVKLKTKKNHKEWKKRDRRENLFSNISVQGEKRRRIKKVARRKKLKNKKK
jgi:hypothetical protein